MYERNAIVIERYFGELLGYKEKCNLKVNYNNYRKLIEAYEKHSTATSNEGVALGEFEKISNEIKRIQNAQEKLYNKGAKLEYSRYIVFENIDENQSEIERCLLQVENEVDKNNEVLKILDKEFLERVSDYKNKKIILERCQATSKEMNKNYQQEYIYLLDIYQDITAEQIKSSNEFINSDNKNLKKDLIDLLNENGKNERTPFDEDVISSAVNLSVELFKRELEVYYDAYDKTKKFLEELEADDVKLDKHTKFLNDSKIKLDFILAEKEYLVQFLDNERVAAIYDKNIHRKLMLEACKNLSLDLAQIDNLYGLILKEIAGRPTKKLYRENYNKKYLFEIERSSESAQRERERVKVNAIAVMNLNYWRIDGIRRIYEVFDKDVEDLYGRDLSEFSPVGFPVRESVLESVSQEQEVEESDVENIQVKEVPTKDVSKNLRKRSVPKLNEILNDMDNFDIDNLGVDEKPVAAKSDKQKFEDRERIKKEIDDIDIFGKVETPSFKKRTKKRFTSSKKALANAIYISLQTHEFSKGNSKNSLESKVKSNKKLSKTIAAKTSKKPIERIEEKEQQIEKPKITENEIKEGEYFDLDAKMASLDLDNDFDENDESLDTILDKKFSEKPSDEEDDDELENLDSLESSEDNETENVDESILNVYFNDKESEKRKKQDDKKLEKEINKDKKGNIFKKIININSKKRKEA